MSLFVIALTMSAAVLHAAWNAFLRGGEDRLRTISIMAITGTVLALPIVALAPLPPARAWIFILSSASLQVFYSFFLVAAYRRGELGQVYPIVRGTVPLLVTLVGVLLRHEVPPRVQVLGVLLVGAGIASLALGRGRAPAGTMLWAFATSLTIASYASLDATGVAHAGNGTIYAAWVLVVFGPLQMLAFTVWRRGRPGIDLRRRATWIALAGGAIAMASYGAVVTAYAYGAAGPITALRETSVVFAVLLGWLFLGERLTAQRFAACVIVAAGTIAIGL